MYSISLSQYDHFQSSIFSATDGTETVNFPENIMLWLVDCGLILLKNYDIPDFQTMYFTSDGGFYSCNGKHSEKCFAHDATPGLSTG